MRSIALVLAAVATLGCAADNSVRDEPSFARLRQKKVLMVVTSHDRLGNTGKKTGYWLEEVTHFYYRLEQAGFAIDIVSPRGGTPPLDPRSHDENDADEVNRAFLDNARASRKLASSLRPDQVRAEDYIVVYFAGGHGAMWDFPADQKLASIAASVYERGGVVAAVCHGPAGLLGIKLSDGRHLIQGKKVTGFSNEEEGLVFLKSDVPYLLEDELEKKSGNNFVQSLVPFTSYAVVSERVVTGQNPMSTDATAEAVLDTLEAIASRGSARR
jgi:putative intracellular protease/amidase